MTVERRSMNNFPMPLDRESFWLYTDSLADAGHRVKGQRHPWSYVEILLHDSTPPDRPPDRASVGPTTNRAVSYKLINITCFAGVHMRYLSVYQTQNG
jgi:hypothetical protein